MSKKKLPQLEYEKIDFKESAYIRDNYKWFASTLYKFAKEEKYPTFDLPIVAIPLDVLPFKVSDFEEFIYQCRRVQDCSLDYPILLDSRGIVCDGNHRVVKAILEGKTTIKAIRLQKMPKYDELIEE